MESQTLQQEGLSARTFELIFVSLQCRRTTCRRL